MSDGTYILACRTDWFWDEWQAPDWGEWHPVRNPEDLAVEVVHKLDPDWIFFPHWSDFVPTEVTSKYRCVCFHAAPVPYGRGGSPVQNMIVRGHDSTKLTALRMTDTLDAGPVFMQRKVSLLGGGDEIFMRISREIVSMIHELAMEGSDPVPQTGEPTVFRRRNPEESLIPTDKSTLQLFDHIRMLDAEGYPPAFVEIDNFRFEFSRPALRRDGIQADVKICRITEDE